MSKKDFLAAAAQRCASSDSSEPKIAPSIAFILRSSGEKSRGVKEERPDSVGFLFGEEEESDPLILVVLVGMAEAATGVAEERGQR